jgi:hypothetical protein
MRRRASIIGAFTSMLLVPLAVPLTLATGASRARVALGGAAPVRARPIASFSWLDPAPAPTGWRQSTTATSAATLFYPPAWKAIPGDKGTVTQALRDGAGRYAGYLNVTPRQGAEQLHGWAAFRITHNREDGDRQVRQVAALEGLRFRSAHGSCVIDDYLSRVQSHPYREIACIVSGHRHTDVFIGAALRTDWRTLGPMLERAASSFVQR